jgi:hypothetical protein
MENDIEIHSQKKDEAPEIFITNYIYIDNKIMELIFFITSD